MQKANCYGGDESVCDKSFPSNVYELLKHIREHSILNSFHESTLLYSTQYLACTFFGTTTILFCTILLNARKKNAM